MSLVLEVMTGVARWAARCAAAVTTLGLGVDETREIGDTLVAVLCATSPDAITSGPNRGKPSLVNFRLEDKVATRARPRMLELLQRHPLYPEIEL